MAEGLSDLLVAAARDRVSGMLAEAPDKAHAVTTDPLTGKPRRQKTYSNALLTMLTKANRPDQFGRGHATTTETARLEIAQDTDPPHIMRGRAG